jgi:predicted alpha-1,6-mannanase (GH76 family)
LPRTKYGAGGCITVVESIHWAHRQAISLTSIKSAENLAKRVDGLNVLAGKWKISTGLDFGQ